MRFQKISQRLFVYILLALMTIITCVVVFQVTLFDDWYLNKKIRVLGQNIETMTASLESNVDRYDYIYQVIEEFQDNNNVLVKMTDDAQVLALDIPMSRTEIAAYGSWVFTVKDEMNNFYYMFADYIGDDKKAIISSLKIGEEILIEGTSYEQSIYPVSINGALLFEDDSYADFGIEFHQTTRDDMKLIEILPNEDIEYISINKSFTIVEMEEINNDATILGGLVETESFYFQYNEYERLDEGDISASLNYFVFQKPFSDVKSLVFEKKLEYENGRESLMYIETSLQSIDELMTLMLPFYIGFYILAGLLSIFIAKVLSVRITRPIIKLNNKAKDLSDLKFSEDVVVTSEDELGELAESMNHMSDTLQSTLLDLSEELEKERKIEGQRKEFIAAVSHELKTPISIASGYLEAIKDGIRKDKHQEYIDITLKEIDKMNDIVLNMLELIRLESEESKLVLDKAEVMPIIRGIYDYFSLMAGDKGISITIPEYIEPVFLEHKTFKSLVLNLMSNAIHYGSFNSTVKLIAYTKENKEVIEIRNQVDDPESIDIDEIWHRFYTKDESRNRKTAGTGLGLSIVRNILELYESDYEAKIEGNEFVFTFTLNI